MTVPVPYERLRPGPSGARLSVIDYDATNDCYYDPVDLDDPRILIQNGLPPSESNPKFHQQMVYAVATKTIGYFESALGRPMRWRFRRHSRGNVENVLRIFPHGMEEANAYYSRELRALVFGYFAAEEEAGSNLPGQTVFTCLSHDIIAHETTHALIDSLREGFMDDTGPDVGAFHEGFADIVALFQHFAIEDALLDTIQRTGGRLHMLALEPEQPRGPDEAQIVGNQTEANPMVELARQFGEALGQRAALRAAIGKKPDPRALDRLFEVHDRGAILVAAVFDAFFTVYLRRTADLLRVARSNGARIGPGDLHPDLAKRLAREAAKVAKHFCRLCIRALDCCPPVDITFGDFLRALVTADSDLVPDDPYGYRDALIQAFRLRGIRPDGVASLSEESLRWQPPQRPGRPPLRCDELVIDYVNRPNKQQLASTAQILSRFGKRHASALGLASGRGPQAFSYHPVRRVSPDGEIHLEFIAELLQVREFPVDAKQPNGPKMSVRGGTTLVMTCEGDVRYAVYKRLSNERIQAQREHAERLLVSAPATAFRGAPARRAGALRAKPIDLRIAHRGF